MFLLHKLFLNFRHKFSSTELLWAAVMGLHGQLCLACSISSRRLLQGTSPLRCLQYRYSSARQLRGRNSDRNSSRWAKRFGSWGQAVLVYSSRAPPTCSFTFSMKPGSSSSFAAVRGDGEAEGNSYNNYWGEKVQGKPLGIYRSFLFWKGRLSQAFWSKKRKIKVCVSWKSWNWQLGVPHCLTEKAGPATQGRKWMDSIVNSRNQWFL